MFYSKNLPAWERVTRVVAGIVMVLCGFMGPGLAGTAVGLVVAAAGAIQIHVNLLQQGLRNVARRPAHKRRGGPMRPAPLVAKSTLRCDQDPPCSHDV